MTRTMRSCSIILIVTLSGAAGAGLNSDHVLFDQQHRGGFFITDAGWGPSYYETQDPVVGWGVDRWVPTLITSAPLEVQVRDDFLVGDQYAIYLDSAMIGFASNPGAWYPTDGPGVGTYSTGSAQAALSPETYTISVQDVAFLTHQPPGVMCAAGYYVSGSVTAILAPGTLLAGLGTVLVGWIRGRREWA